MIVVQKAFALRRRAEKRAAGSVGKKTRQAHHHGAGEPRGERAYLRRNVPHQARQKFPVVGEAGERQQ